MNLSRRGFLGAIAAALVADPERLLWVPGKKIISIPKPQRVSITAEEIIHQAMRTNGILAAREGLSREDSDYALRTLSQMLDRWNRPMPTSFSGVRDVSLGLAHEIAQSYGIYSVSY